MIQADAIVIGAGAAGLMCALTAGQRGRRVVVLDHARKLGTKILISGGGRCNFTNLGVTPERFVAANPHFAKSALARYTQWDFIDLVERHGIAYHEKTLGQLFCDGSARQILDMLLAECAAGGVTIRTGETVTEIGGGDRFRVTTDRASFESPSLVIATGGPSVPKTGATRFAYGVAEQFGLPLRTPEPGLVPFTLDDAALDLAQPLSGVAVDSVAACGKTSFRENILFTHRGLSGPAVLQVSNYWDGQRPIRLDLLPDVADTDALVALKRRRPKLRLKAALAEWLPARLAEKLTAQLFNDAPLGDTKDTRLRGVVDRLKAWEVTPSGTEGFAKAEVTKGGVDTGALSSKTMEAKNVPGLYMIGEAVDVTGWLGGYNFQWAWSSGWCAGQAL
jgi:predicted Rossmann fold flavoprotein